MATNQAKWAINKMLEAGFERKDFTVKTSTKVYQRDGIRHREYGDAVIIVWNRQRMWELAEQILAADLHITVMIGETFQNWHISDDYKSNGTITVVDMTQADEYGMHVRWQQIS